VLDRLLWYTDAPAGTTDLVYESHSRLQPMASHGGVTTDASTVTVTSVVQTNGGFAVCAAGDRIEIKQPGPDYALFKSKIAVKNTDFSIDLADAIDLSTVGAAAWYWQKRSKGTATTDGWVSCGTLQSKSIKIDMTTLPTSGFNLSIEGRYATNQAPEVIYQRQYTAVTDFPAIIQVTESIAAIRVGLSRVAAGSDGSITIGLYGNPTQ
jgi:hypothetical protein